MVLMTSSSPDRAPARALVALTPVLGTVLFAALVPVLMVRVNIATGMAAAVLIGSLWFAAMLRTAEMPGHH
jgi:hypothetical protein